MTDEGQTPAENAAEKKMEPTKLLRIGIMTREMLAEARRGPLDEKAQERLQAILEKTVDELKRILPEELQQELSGFTLPFGDDPSEAELRLAQAQLVGWLEGVFHGIQASMFAQQLHTQAQGDPKRELSDGGGRGQYL